MKFATAVASALGAVRGVNKAKPAGRVPVATWYPDEWMPFNEDASCPSKCHLSRMSAFITFTLGYCIYQAIRAVKSYFRCESLCRAGHCAHHLHNDGYAPRAAPAKPVVRSATPPAAKVLLFPAAAAAVLHEAVVNGGAAVLLFALRLTLQVGDALNFVDAVRNWYLADRENILQN
jgi:hypothetical protein